MKKIKYSHNYLKLQDCFSEMGKKEALLLQAVKVHYDDLSEVLKLYDTKYKQITLIHRGGYYWEEKLYPLPETDLILLIFTSIGIFNRLFTTIRRYTPEKWKYYKGSEGQVFEVIVQEGCIDGKHVFL